MRLIGFTLASAAAALLAFAGPAAPQAPAPAASVAVPIVNPGASVADYLACLRRRDVMMLSAHRGGPVPGFPENAIETFAHTLAEAPLFIETDVRMSADGVLVLMHDDTLERTTDGAGPIASQAYSDLARLRLEDDLGRRTEFAIPTLEQALAWARGRAILQLDVKSGAPIERVAQAVAAAGAQSYAAVIAYTEEDALKAAAVDPRITVSVQILDIETLDRLEAKGLPASRLMAWTGVETEREALWRALNARGVSAAWGSLWYMDQRVMESGSPAEYAKLLDKGLDVLSSDLHFLAYETASRRRDIPRALRACNAGR